MSILCRPLFKKTRQNVDRKVPSTPALRALRKFCQSLNIVKYHTLQLIHAGRHVADRLGKMLWGNRLLTST